jgi:hypothetical protein
VGQARIVHAAAPVHKLQDVSKRPHHQLAWVGGWHGWRGWWWVTGFPVRTAFVR